jgi:hypothetical protein
MLGLEDCTHPTGGEPAHFAEARMVPELGRDESLLLIRRPRAWRVHLEGARAHLVPRTSAARGECRIAVRAAVDGLVELSHQAVARDREPDQRLTAPIAAGEMGFDRGALRGPESAQGKRLQALEVGV